MKAIYNYARVSSSKQRKGIGLETQTQRKVLEKLSGEYNLPVADHVYVDVGKSGFKGAHLDGAMGEVLAAIDNGTIAQGSILVVFNLDRLSRQNVNLAMQQFLNIINRGVRIYTATDNKIFDAASPNLTSDLIISLITMQRAFEESFTKRQRSFEYVLHTIRQWEANKVRLKQSKRPFWVGEDYQFNEWEAAARLIIKRRLEGGHSMQAIADEVHSLYPRQTRKGDRHFTMGAISKFCANTDNLVGDRIVTYRDLRQEGEPEVKHRLVGYYPALLDREQALIVANNNVSNSNNKGAGRTTISLLDKANILYCGDCGQHLFKHTVNGGWRYRCASQHTYTSTPACGLRHQHPDVVDRIVILLANCSLSPAPTTPQSVDIQTQIQQHKDALNELTQRYKSTGSLTLLDLIQHEESEIKRLESEVASVSRDTVTTAVGLAGQYYNDEILNNYTNPKRKELRAALIKAVERVEIASNGWSKEEAPFNAGVIRVKVRGRDPVTVEFYTKYNQPLPNNPTMKDVYRCCDAACKVTGVDKQDNISLMMANTLLAEIMYRGMWFKLYPHRGHNKNPTAKGLIQQVKQAGGVGLPSNWLLQASSNELLQGDNTIIVNR